VRVESRVEHVVIGSGRFTVGARKMFVTGEFSGLAGLEKKDVTMTIDDMGYIIFIILLRLDKGR
jgi:hypothetical protein